MKCERVQAHTHTHTHTHTHYHCHLKDRNENVSRAPPAPKKKKIYVINLRSKTIKNYTTDQSELMALFLGQQLSDPSSLHGLLHRIFGDLVNQKDRLLLYVVLYKP